MDILQWFYNLLMFPLAVIAGLVPFFFGWMWLL